MEDREIRAALERHGAASDESDFAVEHEIYREDAVLYYPQSGERTAHFPVFQGRELRSAIRLDQVRPRRPRLKRLAEILRLAGDLSVALVLSPVEDEQYLVLLD